MAVEYGVVLASLMGAAAALMGGVLAQRYQYLLEKQAEHFAVLRDSVLVPWGRAIGARKSNLEGRDPHVVIDYVARDYRFTAGASMTPSGEVPWSESSLMAQASRRHWPALWKEWESLNKAHEEVGARTIALLKRLETSFPALPSGKEWANYPDQPDLARRMAVVNTWATHSQTFERRTYPDWLQSQLTQFGFWRSDDLDEKRAFARQVESALASFGPDAAALEAATESLSRRYADFERRVEDAIHKESIRGRCDYCPRFLR